MTDKKIALFFPFDFLSHSLRCFQLADAVREEFDIHFASSQSEKTNLAVRSHGFKLVECLNVNTARMVERESRLDHSWLRREE